MLSSGPGVGEWGFSAVVDVDGRRILFDTGGRPEGVLKNAKELHVDLSNIPDVILSHHHPDHAGGLLTLRKSALDDNQRST
jgi:7,8-dihydropterin-6-yl-methyl-4-(beta-D-ribofuranosyl)aminobenzene 5'-phosphate synthase